MYQRQGGMDLFIHLQIGCFDARLCDGVPKLLPKEILSHFSNERRLMSQFCQHRQHIAGSASRVRLEQRVSLAALSVFRKIDQ